MNDKEHRTQTDRSESDPTFLFECRFLALRQSTCIVKHKECSLESKAMLE